jgi:hypothetical protein
MVPNICPPHRPDKNAYVERYHRTYKQECLLVHRPSTLSEVRTVTEQFLHHYNEERPLKAASLRQSSPACGLSHPTSAFPTAHQCAAQSLAPAVPPASLCPLRRRLPAVSWSIYRPTTSRGSWPVSRLLWWLMRRSVALPSGKPQHKSAAFPSRACWKQTRCPWSSLSRSCNVRRAPKHNGTSSTIEASTSARCGRSHKGGNAQTTRSHEKKLCCEGSSGYRSTVIGGAATKTGEMIPRGFWFVLSSFFVCLLR